VRVAGVADAAAEDRDALDVLLRDDPDARVRRAAVAFVRDSRALAHAARHDADDRVREDAAAQLLGVALETDDDAVAATALEGIASPRHLMQVARSARVSAMREQAVERLASSGESRALGSVARHAEDAAIRTLALSRLTEVVEIAGVAVRSEHRDIALAALERVEDEASLDIIATRARQKSVARRARARLDELRAATAVPDPAEQEAADRRARDERRLQLCRSIETVDVGAGLSRPGGPAELEAHLADAEAEWADLAGYEPPSDDLARRFAAGRDRVRARLAAHAADAARVRAREETRARATAEHVAICDRLDAAQGEEIPEALAEARRAWASLSAMSASLHPHDAADLAHRFERACRAAERRQERALGARAARERMAELVEHADRLADAESTGETATLWKALREEWGDLRKRAGAMGAPGALGAKGAEGAEGAAGADDLESRFHQAEQRFNERHSAARAEHEKAARQNLARLQQLAEQVEKLAATEPLMLKHADRALLRIREALEHLEPMPSKADRDAVADRLRQARAALYPRVQEQRSADDWRRWANVGVQEQLCARTEALLDLEDPAEAARQLRDIRQQWKQSADVPRERAQALWNRFKAAQDRVRDKLKDYFAQQEAQRAELMTRREALVAEAESLAESTDWGRTAKRVGELQAEWKAMGALPGPESRAIWERFRRACDRFFTRRKQDLHERKESWAANLARKEALCAQAEALAESTDWAAASAALKKLQAEWKTVGPVRRNKSDAIWQRFRGACDRFFERYKQRDQIAAEAAVSDREAVCAELEALADATPPPDDLVDRLRALRAKWQQGAVLPRGAMEQLQDRFNAALLRLTTAHPDRLRKTDLDPDANRRRMEQLCERVEKLVASIPTPVGVGVSSADMLAARLREALATNTIGGRVDEEAKWRTALDDVRQAQAAWSRIGPLPPDIARPLATRFKAACDKFFETKRARR